MMENAIKALAIASSIIIVLALTFVALGIISWRLFWVIAIIAAIVAYYVIPKLKKQKQ